MPEKQVLNQREAAEFLGIARLTLRQLTESNAVPCRMLARRRLYSREALLRWLEGEKEAQVEK